MSASAPTIHPGLLTSDSAKPELAEILRSDPYLRERCEPHPQDGLYIILSDLKLALEPFRTDAKITVLDFGCGGSPYRTLFPNAKYLRADVSGTDLDYLISKEGTIDASSGSCDLILSTQVLEHVSDPALYLKECFRLLKPGGRLLCSTHGMFEEHPCPNDWNRWTAQGFRRDLERAGFAVADVFKLTTGPRAVMFFLDLNFHDFSGSKTTVFGAACGVFKRVWSRYRVWLHRSADKFFAKYRVARESDSTQTTYIAVLADCRRPAD
jgi:SAM-dependent methyltransferase